MSVQLMSQHQTLIDSHVQTKHKTKTAVENGGRSRSRMICLGMGKCMCSSPGGRTGTKWRRRGIGGNDAPPDGKIHRVKSLAWAKG